MNTCSHDVTEGSFQSVLLWKIWKHMSVCKPTLHFRHWAFVVILFIFTEHTLWMMWFCSWPLSIVLGFKMNCFIGLWVWSVSLTGLKLTHLKEILICILCLLLGLARGPISLAQSSTVAGLLFFPAFITGVAFCYWFVYVRQYACVLVDCPNNCCQDTFMYGAPFHF
jgi:hypothetical protein